jgi:hypothetical protein
VGFPRVVTFFLICALFFACPIQHLITGLIREICKFVRFIEKSFLIIGPPVA